MAELKVKACGFSMAVKGSEELIKEERTAFYDYVTGNVGKVVMDLFGAGGEACEPSKSDFECDAQDAGLYYLHTQNLFIQNWEDVSRAIKGGTLNPGIGDSIIFKLTDGQEVDAVVTQVTDEFVRFESRDCVSGPVCWNENGSNEGGYPESDLKVYVDEKLWNLLPVDLRNVISNTQRKWLDEDGNEGTYECKLFLPAASEVFDEDECYGDKGLYEQLEWYKSRKNRIRCDEDDDTCTWWLSSVRSGYSTFACYVTYLGHASYYTASSTLRVPLCFQISKS